MLKNIVLAAIVSSAAACTAQTTASTAGAEQQQQQQSAPAKLACEVSEDLKTLKLSGSINEVINDGDVLIRGFESSQPETMLYVKGSIKATLDVESRNLKLNDETVKCN